MCIQLPATFEISPISSKLYYASNKSIFEKKGNSKFTHRTLK